MLHNNKIAWDEIGVKAEVSEFSPEGQVAEFHVIMHVEPRGEQFAGQLDRIYKAESLLMSESRLAGSQVVMKRYFLSDSTNQQPLMRRETECAVSYIQQPPLDGSKIAVWIYLIRGMEVTNDGGTTVASHNGYTHLWRMGMVSSEGNSYCQTQSLLTGYEADLQRFGATLADNCIRTWFFVRDVDTQYAGMVVARRENFTEQGLTSNTHYIASTGIGGSPSDTHALIQLGAYALTGFEPEQQHYLYAPTHLNPTYEYGVTFERGTLIEYGDRAHAFISGTASINNRGEVVHVGDIVRQTERMWENVGALLNEGGTTWDDVMQIIVYLRDVADYETVSRMFAERFPDTPYVITLAPVCRPTWLIEMECVAVNERHNSDFRDL